MSGKSDKNRFTNNGREEGKKKSRGKGAEVPEKISEKSPEKMTPKSSRDAREFKDQRDTRESKGKDVEHRHKSKEESSPILKPKPVERKMVAPAPAPAPSDSEGSESNKQEDSPIEDTPTTPEYEMEVMAMCTSEEQRLLIERELVHYISNDLKISPHDINIAGYENELSLSCRSQLHDTNATLFASNIRKKLYEIAIRHKICFEVDYNSDVEPIGTCFVGIGEDDRDTDYLLEELLGVLPRLAKRTNRLSKRFNIPEDSLKKALAVLWSLQNN